ncbi:MAG: hypothetical protein R3E01_09255 [Pirellulaceae bacterium]|nr:hypothetical protein [Planctomycetales bacterium]
MSTDSFSNADAQANGDLDQAYEDLIAYLDNELDDRRRHEVERRLADDPGFRDKLRGLQSSWDMLDELPSESADESFTRTTLEIVATNIEQSLQKDEASFWNRPFGRRVKVAIVVGAAFTTGFLIVFAIAKGIAFQYERDLGLWTNYRLYQNIDSIEFLRSMRDKGLFLADRVADTSESPRDSASSSLGAVVEDGTTMVNVATNVPTKTELLERRQNFYKLSPDEQRRYRRLYSQLASADDRDSLQQTLVRYDQWLTRLPGTEDRLEIRRIDSLDERLARIEEIKKQQELEELIKASGSVLTQEDGDHIFKWFIGFARDHSGSAARGMGGRGRGGGFFMSPQFWESLPEPTDAEWRGLLDGLSDGARDAMIKVGDRKAQWQMLSQWRQEFRDRMMPSRQVHNDQLESVYDELSNEKKRELDKMLPEEMKEYLANIVRERQRAEGPNRPRIPFGPGGPGGPGMRPPTGEGGPPPMFDPDGPRRRNGRTGPPPDDYPPGDPLPPESP